MPTIEVNGERLGYLTQGKGPPLVLLHGIGASADLWGGVLGSLGAEYAAYAISLRAHGGSSCNGALLVETLAEDVKAAAEALGLESYHLVGVSLGGAAALSLAAMEPKAIRSLVVCGVGLESSQALADEIYGIREAVHYLAPEVFAQQVAEAMLVPDTPNRQREALSRSITKLTKQRYLQALEAFSAAQLTAVVKQVKAPILVLRGELDELVSKENADALALSLGAARAEIAGAGHLANIDNPAAFADKVLEFFRR